MALIFLCGMPGAGKSTVGKLLAEMRGSPFLDLDLEIERFAGKSIPAIFQSEGEAHFRRLESLCLQDALSLSEGVIALGGGALESERNLELLKENGTLVFLQVDAESLAQRIAHETHRPLLEDARSEQDVKHKLDELLKRRESNFREANYTIEATDKFPEDIATEIHLLLK
ncbi:shikimate kinase [bacterium]|nr:shikimate kinase [bacterium]